MYHLPWSACFPNKVIIPCLNTLSPKLLVCHEAVSRVSLDLGTRATEQTRSFAAWGYLALIREYWGKALAAAGTICSEDLPFKIPWSGTGCLSTGHLKQGTDKLLRVDQLDFVEKVAPVCTLGTYSPSIWAFPLWDKSVCLIGVPCWRGKLLLDSTWFFFHLFVLVGG